MIKKFISLVIILIIISCEPIGKYDPPSCSTLRYGNVEILNASTKAIYVNIGIQDGERYNPSMLKENTYVEVNQRITYNEVPCGTLIYFVSYDSINWHYKRFNNYLTPCGTSDWFWTDERLRSTILE